MSNKKCAIISVSLLLLVSRRIVYYLEEASKRFIASIIRLSKLHQIRSRIIISEIMIHLSHCFRRNDRSRA